MSHIVYCGRRQYVLDKGRLSSLSSSLLFFLSLFRRRRHRPDCLRFLLLFFFEFFRGFRFLCVIINNRRSDLYRRNLLPCRGPKTGELDELAFPFLNFLFWKLAIMYGEDGIDLKIKENKAYYDTICCRLNIDGETSRNGWKVYERILALRIKPIQRQGTTSSALGTRQILTTCALFVASINNKQMSLSGSLVQGSCLQLTQLLTETNVRFTEFLEYGSFVLDMLKSSEENKDNFKVLMEKFNVGKLIFEKFKGLWDNTRLAYQDVEETEDSDEEHSYSENKNRLLMKFAWIFFLNSKSRIIGNGAAAADLAKSFHILVTCLHWVVLRSYRAKLNSEDLLKFLCQSAKMEITELTNARKQLNTFVETLRGESSLLRGVVTAPLTDEGVLGSRFLRKNVTSLSREYANVSIFSIRISRITKEMF